MPLSSSSRPIPRGLYAILDPAQCGGREPVAYAKALLDAGVRLLQLRDKDYRAGRTLALARGIGALCQQRGALFVVNDRLDVALLSGAPALHLGPDDLPVAVARREYSGILGRSTNSVNEAKEAVREGADYVAFGPLFETSSKTGSALREKRTLEDLSRLCREVSVPVFGIGGITLERAAGIAAAGAWGAAVIGALVRADDLATVCRAFSAPFSACSPGGDGQK
ncbi:MAG: thiamine phosphate synthase [Bdellovibrionota bacterium]